MKSNQNLLIAQVVKYLNSNGCLVWRQENNGRIDEAAAVARLTELLFALAHVKYDRSKIADLIKGILRKAYRPVPCSLKGIPDVIGFYLDSGRWITVECKCGTDVIRPEQRDFINILREAGGDAWVIREFDSLAQNFHSYTVSQSKLVSV